MPVGMSLVLCGSTTPVSYGLTSYPAAYSVFRSGKSASSYPVTRSN